MKRSKRIFILLGILVVAIAATFAVTRVEERKEQIQNTDEVILAIAPDTVTSLHWTYGDTDLSFHKEETWLYDGDEAFPVDQEAIADLLSLFESFGAAFIIEEVEDFGQYGLEDPECTIELTAGETSRTVTLGAFSTMDSQRYVSIGDGNVYLVNTDPLDKYDAVLSDLIDHDETPAFEAVTAVEFSGLQDYSITYEEDSTATWCPDDVYFAQLDGGEAPLDTARVEDYLSALSNLDPTDYVTYNATDEELQSFGLDSPELTVTVHHTTTDEEDAVTGHTFTLHMGRDPEQVTAAQEAAGDEDAEEVEISCYVRVGGSRIVYQVTADEYAALTAAAYNDLRHREVLTADFETVTALDITLEGETYTLTSTMNGDEETVWTWQEEEVDLSALQSALQALSAHSFTDEEPTGKEEISLTVHLDNETWPEINIGLYRYNGEHCLALLNGTPVSLIPRADAVDLMEAVRAIVLN